MVKVVKLVLIAYGLLAVHLRVSGQGTNDYLTVDFTDLSFETILDSISFKSGYFFSYNADAIPEGSLYTLKNPNIHIDTLLKKVLVGSGLDYHKEDNQIILKSKPRDYSYRVVSAKGKTAALKGRVRFYDSNREAGGVNVFLNGTTIGTVTNDKGSYTIEGVPPGPHQLILSHVGYETNAYQIKVNAGNTYVLNSMLKPKHRELPEIQITTLPLVDSAEWMRHYRVFKREFIGTSHNSRRCEIENPEAVGFTFDKEKNILKAYLDTSLVLLNHSLGYKVICEVESFEKKENLTRFHIRAMFENLTYHSLREKRRWKKNRRLSYLGSSTHFLKSLISGKYQREGFSIQLMDHDRVKEVERDSIIHRDNRGGHYLLSFNGTLQVTYFKEPLSAAFLHFMELQKNEDPDELTGLGLSGANEQMSFIKLLKNEVVLFENGQIESPADLVRLGYWSWERIADLVPVNYYPGKDEW